MFNSFLVTLVNLTTGPTNPGSEIGHILWPTSFRLRTYTPVETYFRRELYGNELQTPLRTLLYSIQLLSVVESSPFRQLITADDPRITYTPEQLAGQFIGQTVPSLSSTLNVIARSQSQLEELGKISPAVEESLTALSPIDKLAAVVATLGRRNG